MRTNNTLALAAALALSSTLLGCLLGCAGAPVTSSPSLLSFSSSQPSASSFESSYAVRSSSAGLIVVDADLVVRPDQVCLPFAVTVRGTDAQDAIAKAKAVVDDIKGKAGAVEASVLVRVDDIRSSVDTGGKKVGDHVVEGVIVVVNGAVVAALGDGDAFSRAAVVAGIAGALWPLAHPKDKDGKALVDDDVAVAVGAAEPGVKDTEQHRAQLLEGWASRIGALSKSVGGDDVDLTNCQAPPSVRITGGTFEKVGLTLPISCTVAVKARA